VCTAVFVALSARYPVRSGLTKSLRQGEIVKWRSQIFWGAIIRQIARFPYRQLSSGRHQSYNGTTRTEDELTICNVPPLPNQWPDCHRLSQRLTQQSQLKQLPSPAPRRSAKLVQCTDRGAQLWAGAGAGMRSTTSCVMMRLL